MRPSVILIFLVLVLGAAGCAGLDPRQTPPPAASGDPGGQNSSPSPASLDTTNFRLELQRVAGGFEQPTFVTHAGDGTGRLFVLERAGTIRIIVSGAILLTPFLDIRSIIRSAGQEQGLLGLAFHPRYRENGRFFVAYTASNGDNTLAEYRVSQDAGRAAAASGKVLLAIPDFAPNHNGGMAAFGPDGYLYMSTGDGGGSGDPQRNGQNLQTLLGKILRLDIDNGLPYGIPPNNPYAGSENARKEIWAYGLRNPWRFSFDQSTGDLWIADVGQNAWEEINLQPASSRGGENYGWSSMEGRHCFRPSTGCDTSGLVQPIAEYGRNMGCSVSGGYVYRGREYPALTGSYFYADYCSGRIWSLRPRQSGVWQPIELLDSDVQISSFGEDEAGEVYVTGLSDGVLYRLTAKN